MASTGQHCRESAAETCILDPPTSVEEVNFKSIIDVALSLRRKLTTSEIPCRVEGIWNASAHHTSLLLHFDDGLNWIFRTPTIAFSPILEKRIISDVWGMQLIQSKTNVPIPRIIDFCASPENPCGRPYVVMEHPRGAPLSTLWCDPQWISDEKRKILFKSLAFTMSKLKALEFDMIGSLYFDNNSNNYTVGPTIPSYGEIVDGYLCTRRTYPTTHTYLLGEIRRQLSANTGEDRKLFLALLRVFAGFVPDHHFDERPFVLSSPNLDLHSVFVDEDLNVTAITEWDSLFVGPREGGYAAYPSWIIVDWDPIIDRYPSPKVDGDDWEDQESSSSESSLSDGASIAESASGYTENVQESEPLDNERDAVPESGDNVGPVQSHLSAQVSVRESTNDQGPPVTEDYGVESGSTVDEQHECVNSQAHPISSDDIPQPTLDSSESNVPLILEAYRQDYLKAFNEVDSTSAQYTRYSHIFNALERTILSAKPGFHILDKFKQFLFGPYTREEEGYLLEVRVLLQRLSIGKWIHDLTE